MRTEQNGFRFKYFGDTPRIVLRLKLFTGNQCDNIFGNYFQLFSGIEKIKADHKSLAGNLPI